MTDVLQPTDVALAREETRRSRIGWWWLALIGGVVLIQRAGTASPARVARAARRPSSRAERPALGIRGLG